jgi:hypothetical protein
MNYLNLIPDDIQEIIYKHVMKTAIQDTIHKPVNRYGDFTLRLGQMHKLILTDAQKTEYLDITDLHADPDEDYLWEPDDDDE